MKYKYFSPSEFLACTPSCSIEDMDEGFLSLLDLARSYSSVPFILNSAYRSVEWEIGRGRSGTSSHCKGMAVDIRCLSSAERYEIVTCLLRAGFSRIGIYGRYIHVDIDSSKPSNLIFMLYV